jgi:hypothetical protein
LSSLVLLATGHSALAQVNVEPLRDKLETSSSTYHLRGSLAVHQGNTNAATASAGTFAGWSGGPYLGYVTLTADYAEADYRANLTKLFGHARLDRLLWGILHGEVFAQWERDPFREIDTRELFGIGPRIEVRGNQWRFNYGVSYMLELTKRRVGEGAGAHVIHHRLNNYATINYAPHPSIALSQTVYFQPRFDRFSDYFLLSVFGAKFDVTNTLATGIDLVYRRESVVPADVESDDLQLINSLSLTF